MAKKRTNKQQPKTPTAAQQQPNRDAIEKRDGVKWEPGKIGDKNALACALNGGYWFEWFADGYCDVHKPDGHIYQVRNWKCDCIAGQHEKTCKHLFWVSQLLGCLKCEKISRYAELKIYSGAVVPVFACRCGYMRGYKDIVKKRKHNKLLNQSFGACVPGSGRVVAGLKALNRKAV